jgi:group I intron endonuclease
MFTIVSHVSNVLSTGGIYVLLNCVNHNCYIGSTVNLLRRKNEHFRHLRAGKHSNAHLQSAYDLYGPDVFQFHVLEHVSHVEDLLTREQHFLDTRKPEYNLAPVADSGLGVIFSPEARAKLSAARRAYAGLYNDLAKATEAARIANTSRKLSLEHIEKLRGKKHTPETLEKMRIVQRARQHSSEEIKRQRTLNIGRKHTPEAREHMGAPKRGRKQSLEHIEKRAAARRGKKQSPEHAAKSRVAFLGGKHTDEAKAKMSVARRGRKQSPEHIEKNAAARRGKKQSPEHVEKDRAAQLGKKMSLESRAKMSAAGRGRKKSPEHVAKIKATKAAKRAAKLAEQQLNQSPLF